MNNSDEVILQGDNLTARDSEFNKLEILDINEEAKKFGEQLKSNDDIISFLKRSYEEIKKKNPKAVCPSCGGKPLKGQTCEVCGAGESLTKLAFIEDITEEVRSELFIPEKYKKITFDSSKLLMDKKELEKKEDFQQYVKILDAILSHINVGKLELSSLYIHAPSGFGKETFAYTAIQLALLNNLTVFPYLDLSEVQRLISAYETGNMRDPVIKDIGFSDIDLYTSDLCILKVPHNNMLNSYKVMLQVIDRRARRGLPTIIMSRYNFKYFTSLDKFKEVEGIVSYNNPSPKNLRVFGTDGRP